MHLQWHLFDSGRFVELCQEQAALVLAERESTIEHIPMAWLCPYVM